MEIKGELFGQNMVTAFLENRKLRTSRPIKFPEGLTMNHVVYNPLGAWYAGGIKRPKYQPGDIMYGRETFQYISPDENYRSKEECSIIYKATDEHPVFDAREYCEVNCLKHEPDNDVVYPWKPSLHMPRSAARLFFRVTNVKAQNIADMTEQDAVEDGFEDDPNRNLNNPFYPSALDYFKRFWTSQYGTESPWMWVYYLEKISKEAALKT